MKSTKIVYNACYGGFGLSPVALKRYAALAGLSYGEEMCEGTMIFASMHDKDGEYVSPRALSRTDPILIQVVEELGDKANDSCAKLCMIALPAGTKYRIEEYDGFETVMTFEDYKWETA
jgi:hypothetical protein